MARCSYRAGVRSGHMTHIIAIVTLHIIIYIYTLFSYCDTPYGVTLISTLRYNYTLLDCQSLNLKRLMLHRRVWSTDISNLTIMISSPSEQRLCGRLDHRLPAKLASWYTRSRSRLPNSSIRGTVGSSERRKFEQSDVLSPKDRHLAVFHIYIYIGSTVTTWK